MKNKNNLLWLSNFYCALLTQESLPHARAYLIKNRFYFGSLIKLHLNSHYETSFCSSQPCYCNVWNCLLEKVILFILKSNLRNNGSRKCISLKTNSIVINEGEIRFKWELLSKGDRHFWISKRKMKLPKKCVRTLYFTSPTNTPLRVHF